MKIVNLRRRKAMKLEAGILCSQSAQEIFVPLDAEVRVQATLHQHPRSTQRDRFIDLCANLIHRPDVSVGRSRPAIKRAERADNVTDVGIVDVPIDDVRNDAVRMKTLTDFIGGSAHLRNVVRLEKSQALVAGHAFARENAVENRLYVGVYRHCAPAKY